MKKWLIWAFLLVLSMPVYGLTYNQTVLWADEYDEDGAPTAGNDVTDLIDGSGEMGAASCDLSTIVAAAAGNPVTVTSAGFGFYTSTGSGSPIQYWELNNIINGSELDGVCLGAFCQALENNMTSLVGVHTGADAAAVWEWYGVNETAMATLFETYINAGEMNISIIKNITDPTGIDIENVRGLDYTTTSQRPRCFIEYTITAPTKTLYVDTDSIGGACSDAYTRAANNITHPWCTLQTGLNNWMDGDILYMREGNYSQHNEPYGARITGANVATDTKILAGYPGENVVVTSKVDACTFGLWTLSSGIYSVPYTGDNEYLRYDINTYYKPGYPARSELLSYDDDAGDMDSYTDMADTTNPQGCYADETTDDYIECRLPSGYNPNTCENMYISNTTATINIDDQSGHPIILANFTIEAARQGIYLRDDENIIIDNVEVLGGEYGIRLDRSINITIKNSYTHIYYWDNFGSNPLAWDEHRKGETAETSGIFVSDDPTNLNVTKNTITGHFNGILMYNNDGDNGFMGANVGYNNFSNIYDDAIEGEGTGYTSRYHNNIITDFFVCTSFHPYNDSTHSTVVDYNLCLDPKYNLFYKGGTYYYGESVKLTSTSSYTEGLNYDHNLFIGNGVKSNTAQTNTLFYTNFTNNIFYIDSKGTRLLDKSGTTANHVHYDFNIYYSSGVYFRYWDSDTLSSSFYSLAAAKATGRGATWDTNSIDADPVIDVTGQPDALSPVCGAGTGGTDIGALPCATGTNYTLYYTSPVYETQTVNYAINITTTLANTFDSMGLLYNGTEYVAIETTQGAYTFFNVTFTIPSDGANPKEFTWFYTVGGVDTNLTAFNVTLNTFSLFNCTGGNVTLNISIYDEDNPTAPLNSAIEVYGDYWIGVGTTRYNFTFSGSGQSYYEICLSPNNVTILSDIYIKYTDAFTHRWYLENQELDNATTELNIYNFDNATGISDITFTMRNQENYAYFKNIIGKMQRYYVGEGVWRTVQMDKTGDYGQLIYNIYEETTDYRFIFMDEENRVLETTEDMKFICNSGHCSVIYLLEPYGSSTEDITTTAKVSYSNETDMVRVDWSDPLGDSVTVNTVVTKKTTTGNTVICNSTSTGATGTQYCDVSSYTGTMYVQVLSTRDGITDYIEAEYIDRNPGALFNRLSVKEQGFWTTAIVSTAMLMGIFSPVAVIITTIIGLIATFFLGIFSAVSTTFIILACVIGMALAFKLRS